MSEKIRLKEVFDNHYYNGLSNTNIKESIDNNTILDLFNDFMLTSQIVNSMILNGKEDLPNLKILDAGCGNGRMIRKICDLGAEPFNCSGIDLSEKIIKFAKINSPYGAEFSVGDIKNTQYFKNMFDVIFNLGVLIHIKDNDYIKEIAKEFHRILKPNGLVFITYAKEGSEWGEKIQDITRNFAENEILGLFDMFECVGIYDAYSNYYTAKDQGNITLSQVMKAFELGAVDSTYKLLILKKWSE